MPKWQFLFPLLINFSFSGFYPLNNNIVVGQSIDKEEDQNSAVFFRANVNRTGYFDENGPVNDKVEKVWSFETENRGIEASPIVYDSTLYLGSSGDHLYAIDSLIWKYKTNHPIGTSSPFIQDGKLYIGQWAMKLSH